MTDEIVRQTQKLEPLLQQLSSALWQAAEPAGAEDASVRVLTEALRSEGFQIEQGLGCQPTAFRAQYGEGTPRIGFMAEYDALPGLWQERVPHPSGDKARAGHGCGHNLLGAGSTAAAIALARALRAGGRPGTVVLYGTPAEETMLGKNRLLKDGYLKDVYRDATPASHPHL